MREQKQRHRCRHTGCRILRGVKMADKYLSGLATEKVDGRFRDIDLASTEEILRIINEEDRKVAPAVAEEIPHIAAAQAWEITVAQAAPATPWPSPATNHRSRPTLMAEPSTRQISGVRVSPTEREAAASIL